MPSTELFLLGVLRTLVEVAGLFLLGQGVLYVLAGKSRETNVIYQLFQIVTNPVTKAVRTLVSRRVSDRSIPFIAFGLLFLLWIGLAYVRRLICLESGLVC